MTPVNTLRLIFNLYFDTDFKLLPDKSYVSPACQGTPSLKKLVDTNFYEFSFKT